VQVAWSNLVPALERGDFDIALNGLESTPSRAEKLRLSTPYYLYSETLAVRRGSPLRWLDLEGKRVGTLNQTYAYDLLRARGIDPILYEGVQEPYLDLAAARIDAVLLDNIIADRYGCSMEGVECLPGAGALGAYVVGIRKSDDRLGAAIDAALADMKSGELRRRSRSPASGTTAGRPAPVAPPRRRRGGHAAAIVRPGPGRPVPARRGGDAGALGGGLRARRRSSACRWRWRACSARRFWRPPGVYVEIFRGTPVLLQLYVLYFALAPVLRLPPSRRGARPRPQLRRLRGEIYRGALLACRAADRGGALAGHAALADAAHVLVPQALRVALPAMTNDFVALLKDSSLVSVITVVELTKRMTIAAVDLNDWVSRVACAALYFAMSFPLAHVARVLEKRLHRDTHSRTA
jgi:polar amino acid transport system substrate-binding protein